MERKTFYYRMFKRKIKTYNVDYWTFLYAEILFRLKALEELKCPCRSCFSDKVKLQHLLEQHIEAGHIDKIKSPANFTGVGDCGRRLKPRA
jgi:hypothetical protein